MDPGTEDPEHITWHACGSSLSALQSRVVCTLVDASGAVTMLEICQECPFMLLSPLRTLLTPCCVRAAMPARQARNRPEDPYRSIASARHWTIVLHVHVHMPRQVPACRCVFGVAPQADSQQANPAGTTTTWGLRSPIRSHDGAYS